MNFLTLNCKYYCGVDLHSNSMVICIMTADGTIKLRRKLSCDFSQFLKVIEPFRASLAVGLESTFNWYWFVDSCVSFNINVYLGHAYYMKAIHCDKKKNDRLDAHKIANLLRAGLFPLSYSCPASIRSTRDLTRRRNKLVNQRSKLLAYRTLSFYQQGLTHIDKSKKGRKAGLSTISDEAIRFGATEELSVVESLDSAIKNIESHILKQAYIDFCEELPLLQQIPGIGPTISTTILYETSEINRFKKRQDYSSFCRLALPEHSSNGKVLGHGKRKCGNPHLKWAYMQIVTNASQKSESIGRLYAELKEVHHPLKARAIMANKFATAVYYILRDKVTFNVKQFCAEVDSQTPEAGDFSSDVKVA
ncbi:IS110 family transposase [Candidatus Peregrinibacteria bacterium]|nr:IS110 family transposase [Candidatus Peregrinibacteria bacterium]